MVKLKVNILNLNCWNCCLDFENKTIANVCEPQSTTRIKPDPNPQNPSKPQRDCGLSLLSQPHEMCHHL